MLLFTELLLESMLELGVKFSLDLTILLNYICAFDRVLDLNSVFPNVFVFIFET